MFLDVGVGQTYKDYVARRTAIGTMTPSAMLPYDGRKHFGTRLWTMVYESELGGGARWGEDPSGVGEGDG